MKTLLKYFEELGYTVEITYSYGSSEIIQIKCTKETGVNATIIHVRKYARKYKVEKAEFVGNSIGRITKLETTKLTAVKELCKR